MFGTGLVASGALPILSENTQKAWSAVDEEESTSLINAMNQISPQDIDQLARKIVGQALLIQELRRKKLPACTPHFSHLLRHADRPYVPSTLKNLLTRCLKGYSPTKHLSLKEAISYWRYFGITNPCSLKMPLVERNLDPTVYGSLEDRLKKVSEAYKTLPAVRVSPKVAGEEPLLVTRASSFKQDAHTFVIDAANLLLSFEEGSIPPWAKLQAALSAESKPTSVRFQLTTAYSDLQRLIQHVESTEDPVFPAELIFPSKLFNEGSRNTFPLLGELFSAWIFLECARKIREAAGKELADSGADQVPPFILLTGHPIPIKKDDTGVGLFNKMSIFGKIPKSGKLELPVTKWREQFVEAIAQKARASFLTPFTILVKGRPTLIHLASSQDKVKLSPPLEQLSRDGWERYMAYINEDVFTAQKKDTLVIPDSGLGVPLLLYLHFMTEEKSSIPRVAFGEKEIPANEVQREIAFLFSTDQLPEVADNKLWKYFRDIYPKQALKNWLSD